MKIEIRSRPRSLSPLCVHRESITPHAEATDDGTLIIIIRVSLPFVFLPGPNESCRGRRRRRRRSRHLSRSICLPHITNHEQQREMQSGASSFVIIYHACVLLYYTYNAQGMDCGGGGGGVIREYERGGTMISYTHALRHCRQNDNPIRLAYLPNCHTGCCYRAAGGIPHITSDARLPLCIPCCSLTLSIAIIQPRPTKRPLLRSPARPLPDLSVLHRLRPRSRPRPRRPPATIEEAHSSSGSSSWLFSTIQLRISPPLSGPAGGWSSSSWSQRRYVGCTLFFLLSQLNLPLSSALSRSGAKGEREGESHLDYLSNLALSKRSR